MKNNNNIKNNNKLNGKNFFAKNRIIIGVVMLVFSLVFGLLLLPNVVATSGSDDVFVLKQNVKEGTVITMDILDKTTTSDQIIIKLAHTSEKDIKEGNLVAKHDLVQGEYLTKINATKDKTGVGDKVPQEKQILSVPVDSIHSTVSYTIRGGDIICFYVASENEYKETVVEIPSCIQYVEVYDVYDVDGISCTVSGAIPKSFSLIVTEEQALEIVKVTSSDDYETYFSLITSGDNEKAAELLARQEKVLTQLENGEDINNIVIDNSDIDSGNLEFNGELGKPEDETEEITEAIVEEAVSENEEIEEENSEE